MQPIIQQLIHYYEHFADQSYDDLITIYDEGITFIDPIHKINGVDCLINYFKSGAQGLTSCEFHFSDQLCSEKEAWLKWEMHYSHQRLAGQKALTLSGASHLCFTDKVYFHQDFYDLGAMVYEHVPLLGSGVGWIKNRLAG